MSTTTSSCEELERQADDDMDTAVYLFLDNNGLPREAKAVLEDVFASGKYESLLDAAFLTDLGNAWEAHKGKTTVHVPTQITADERMKEVARLKQRRSLVDGLSKAKRSELRKEMRDLELGNKQWPEKYRAMKHVLRGAQRDSSMQKAAERQIKEGVFYLLFLFCMTWVSMTEANDPANWRFEHRIKTQVAEVEFPFSSAHVMKSFDDVATVEELYQWMWGPLHAALYSSGTFDGDPSFAVNRRGFIFGQDMIMGGVRVSQLRVEAEACDVPTELTDRFMNDPSPPTDAHLQFLCYPELSEGRESTAPFGGAAPLCPVDWSYREDPDGTQCDGAPLGPYTYQKTDEPVYTSRNDEKFPSVGFSEVLPNRNGSLAMQMVNTLYASHFIDLQTRAVFVDINVYNANIDRISVARFAAEMYPTGGVFTTHKFLTARLYVHSGSDRLMLAMEIVLLLFVVVFIAVEAGDVLGALQRGHAVAYLQQPATYIHIINLMVYVAVVRHKWYSLQLVPSGVNVGSDEYLDFRSAVDMRVNGRRLNAVNVLLCWLKVFKYFDFIPELAQLTDTLARAQSGVVIFVVMFSVVLSGAGLSFLLGFGSHLLGYQNFSRCMFSLLTNMLGAFRFDELYDVDQVLGPLLFVVFVVLSVFILLNMFVAILGIAYQEVQERMNSEEGKGDQQSRSDMRSLVLDRANRMPLVGWMLRCMVRVGSEINLRVKIRRLSQDEKKEATQVFQMFDNDNSGTISKYECRLVVQHLLPFVPDRELVEMVDAFFKKVDVNGSGDLDYREYVLLFRRCCIMREMEAFKRHILEDVDADESSEDFMDPAYSPYTPVPTTTCNDKEDASKDDRAAAEVEEKLRRVDKMMERLMFQTKKLLHHHHGP